LRNLCDLSDQEFLQLHARWVAFALAGIKDFATISVRLAGDTPAKLPNAMKLSDI